jgi:CBS domain-containing protein
MKASDVMVRDVITVSPETSVDAAVKLLAEHDVSALPVIGADGNLVGILSEADLIHRAEIGTEKHRPWWLESLTAASTLAAEFTKSHGQKVGEIMTSHVVSVSEDASLGEIAALFERKRIKRVPVVKDGKLVGIVSRSNLIQALASHIHPSEEHEDSDRSIRLELLSRMQEQDWTDFGSRNVIVTNGVVHLWGLVGSEQERTALIALAETVPGVVRVADEMIPAYSV